MSEMMTGAEMVIRALQDQGVEHLFGYPGGAVLPIYDALFHQDKVKHVLGRPGPVVVDLPKDIQFQTGAYARPTNNQHKTYRPAVKGDIDRIRAAVELM